MGQFRVFEFWGLAFGAEIIHSRDPATMELRYYALGIGNAQGSADVKMSNSQA